MPLKPSANRIRRGSIVLVPFPNSDLRSGKIRPALVVQSDNLDSEIPQLIVAMISSNTKRSGRKSRILIETNSENGKLTGLVLDSVIMTDNLSTIRNSGIIRVIGRFPLMSEVDSALRHTLGL